MSVYPPQTIFMPYRRPVRMFHYIDSSEHYRSPAIPTDYSVIQTVELFGQEYYMMNTGCTFAKMVQRRLFDRVCWGIKLPYPTIPLTVDIRDLAGDCLMEEGTDYIVDKGIAWLPDRYYSFLDISGAIDTWEGRARREWR